MVKETCTAAFIGRRSHKFRGRVPRSRPSAQAQTEAARSATGIGRVADDDDRGQRGVERLLGAEAYHLSVISAPPARSRARCHEVTYRAIRPSQAVRAVPAGD